ncbi:hypothetical protein [Burkholderia sp. WAC0059]|uniref:hypothetical protein n=1 Tax=Burkholderia sp. WAC0059 TaxID=2066022 RepID=UPI0011AF6197|nr:hypothetical protein [Burkholderia sp. WAC0059]
MSERTFRGEASVAVVSSAPGGSVTGNERGGWEGYRASKAVLNMRMRSRVARRPANTRARQVVAPGDGHERGTARHRYGHAGRGFRAGAAERDEGPRVRERPRRNPAVTIAPTGRGRAGMMRAQFRAAIVALRR